MQLLHAPAAPHELHRLLIHAQLVGIHYAAREEQRVERVRVGALEREVDLELFAPMIVLPAFDLPGLRRDERGLRARFVERFAWLGELDLLDTIGRENRDALSGEFVGCHRQPPKKLGA